MANPAMDNSSVKDIEQNIHKFSRESGERAGELASQVADTTAEYYNAGRSYLKANPVQGAAYAAATGFVVGSLLTLIFRGRK
jgi:ElaB/YqjD/DUF883 family membrane-anchored ribosome-binding protein